MCWIQWSCLFSLLQPGMFPYFSLDFHDFERPVIVGYLSLWVRLMLPRREIPEVWQEFTEEVVGEQNNFSSTLFNLVFGSQQIKLTKERLARGKKNRFNLCAGVHKEM